MGAFILKIRIHAVYSEIAEHPDIIQRQKAAGLMAADFAKAMQPHSPGCYIEHNEEFCCFNIRDFNKKPLVQIYYNSR